MSKNIFSVQGNKTLVNGKPFLAKGLRLSSGLYSDKITDDLIENLPLYKQYGINSFSVFFMGNRFTDIAGYREDGSLSPEHKARMARIIEAADELDLIVLVGCLYWGESRAKWDSWTIEDCRKAVGNTVSWLSENDYRNTLVDVDNEGMGWQFAKFPTEDMIDAAHGADSTIPAGNNCFGKVPDNADICLHHSEHVDGKPYIESEGTPWNAPGGYWGTWSRKRDGVLTYGNDKNFWNYLRVGQYTLDMKQQQIETATEHFVRGDGYFFSSTWFQAAPPLGPNHAPGGYGGEKDPGFLWYLEWLRDFKERV